MTFNQEISKQLDKLIREFDFKYKLDDGRAFMELNQVAGILHELAYNLIIGNVLLANFADVTYSYGIEDAAKVLDAIEAEILKREAEKILEES